MYIYIYIYIYIYNTLKSFSIKLVNVMSLKYTYILSHELLHMMWSQGSCIFRIRSFLDGKGRYFFISSPWLFLVAGCLIYIGVNVVFMYHTYIICTHTATGLFLKFCPAICWRVPLCGKPRDSDLRRATAHNINHLISVSCRSHLPCTTGRNYSDRSRQLGSSQQDLTLLPTQADVASNFHVMTS